MSKAETGKTSQEIIEQTCELYMNDNRQFAGEPEKFCKNVLANIAVTHKEVVGNEAGSPGSMLAEILLYSTLSAMFDALKVGGVPVKPGNGEKLSVPDMEKWLAFRSTYVDSLQASLSDFTNETRNNLGDKDGNKNLQH